MIKYRRAEISDYKSFVDIHTQAFEGFFLTTLGYNFLCTYYSACLKNRDTIAICAYTENNKIIGFASGSIMSLGYHKKIVLNNFFKFSLALLQVIFTKPAAIFRLLNNLDKTGNVNDKGDYSELLSIAILPEYKGKRIGKQILLEFENEAKRSSSDKIALTTDSVNNDEVIEFYRRSGYEIFYEFITYPNRKMLKMIKINNNLTEKVYKNENPLFSSVH